MKVSEMRTELLGQHEALRRLAGECRAAAKRYAADEPGGKETFQSSLDQLEDALRAHNTREEELLAKVLPTLDAWGDERAWWMDKRHAQEHARLLGALVASGGGPGEADRAEGLILELLEHMDREEQEFLSPEVLSDDTFRRDTGFDG